MVRIGFLGCGKMAGALVGAMLKGGAAKKEEIWCSDVSGAAREKMAREWGVGVTGSNREVVERSEVVVLSVKPQSFGEAAAGLGEVVRGEQLIVSIMAGVRIEAIRACLPGKVVRVMPNTACLVGEMAGGYALGPGVSEADAAVVRRLLGCAGVVVEVREKQMDAVTGLSGSGPAFVAYLIESFIGAGVKAGLDERTARALTLKTFEGTAKLLSAGEMATGELIAMVSSPKGTTVAGREILEASGVREVIEQTVRRAAERSRELALESRK